MNMFQEIKDAVSVRDAASFYGLKVNRNGMCVCPFHPDKHPSMKVDERFHCFACQADGDVINFVQRLFNLDIKEAARKIIDDFNLNIDFGKKETRAEHNERIRKAKRREYEQSVQITYANELQVFRNRLSNIFRMFYRWEIDFSPTKEQWEKEFIDERYITAVQNKDSLEYILDVLDNGTDEDIFEQFKHREETIKHYERKITNIKR